VLNSYLCTFALLCTSIVTAELHCFTFRRHSTLKYAHSVDAVSCYILFDVPRWMICFLLLIQLQDTTVKPVNECLTTEHGPLFTIIHPPAARRYNTSCPCPSCAPPFPVPRPTTVHPWAFSLAPVTLTPQGKRGILPSCAKRVTKTSQ
jgi:hypothetical protein